VFVRVYNCIRASVQCVYVLACVFVRDAIYVASSLPCKHAQLLGKDGDTKTVTQRR